MLRSCQVGLRAKAVASTRRGSLRSLRRQLTDLKAANAAATAQLAERRRLATLMQRHSWEQQRQGHAADASTGSSTSSASSHAAAAAAAAAAAKSMRADALRLLPRNPELESAIAFTLRENRDARTELEFTRHLLNSTLLSLASPVGPWDPYDVKPQVFALDNYLALPVFTSLEYLTLFCERFGFTTRDPSGVLWADGSGGSRGAGAAPVQLAAPPEGVTCSVWWGKEHQSQRAEGPATGRRQEQADAEAGTAAPLSVEKDGAAAAAPDRGRAEEAPSGSPAELDAASLFDDLEDPTPLRVDGGAAEGKVKPAQKKRRRSKRTGAAARILCGSSGKSLKRRVRVARRKKVARAAAATPGTETAKKKREEEEAAAAKAAKEAFWASVARVSPFRLQQATPLPTFGPFVYPFFIGYFADVNTLLHNATIVPEKVDIILNPTSPTEFVLAREATDRVLHRDQLLLLAYQRVERELQREFSTFFSRYCPEVRCARSACIPRPLDRRSAARAMQASRGFSDGENPLQEQRSRTQLLREATYTGGVGYDLAVVMRSDDPAATYRCLQWGKQQCLLMGHPDLDVLPEEAAAPHVVEASHVFYTPREARPSRMRNGVDDGDRAHQTDNETPDGQSPRAERSSDARLMGMLRKMGKSQTVNVAQPADSYFHDPTNAYTEAHAVFTEELKVKRGQR